MDEFASTMLLKSLKVWVARSVLYPGMTAAAKEDHMSVVKNPDMYDQANRLSDVDLDNGASKMASRVAEMAASVERVGASGASSSSHAAPPRGRGGRGRGGLAQRRRPGQR